MKFYLEVINEYVDAEEELMNRYEFNSLEEARKFAQPLITADEEKGLDYAYFIVDEDDSDTWYDIWEKV